MTTDAKTIKLDAKCSVCKGVNKGTMVRRKTSYDGSGHQDEVWFCSVDRSHTHEQSVVDERIGNDSYRRHKVNNAGVQQPRSS